jgi:two-component system CheB/CheR fusion protein
LRFSFSHLLAASGKDFPLMNAIRVLLLEGSPPEADLTLATLRGAGLDCEAVRVDNRESFVAGLRDVTVRLVLADHHLPGLDGSEALRLARELRPETPFLFVSDTLAEEAVVEALRGGAADCVHKQRRGRLVPAVRRALAESEERSEHRREADRRKDEFLAMLGHELRNPLSPIRSAVEVMREQGPGDATLRWAGQVIQRQVEHLSRLLDDLLDLSRVSRDQITLRKERTGLATAVAGAVETIRPLVEGRGQELEVVAPPEPLVLEADPIRLVQLLTNLLHNATKYTPAGGRIRLGWSREGGEAVVRLRDSGRGIDPRLLPHVFDAFVQAEQSLERTQGGLGVGLTVVRRLVQMHGGSVEAHSEGPGKGSEFVVRLPLASGPPDVRPDDAVSPAVGTGPARAAEGRRVLVVDDNVDGALTLALLLELRGNRVSTAFDGPAGLELARAERPDAVILDIGLPGLDGYEVARRLRQGPETARAMLIAVTGYGQEQDRRQALEAGFDYHLVKPVDPELLAGLLERPAPADALRQRAGRLAGS